MSEWLREVEQTSYSIQYTGPELETSPLLPSETVRETRVLRFFWITFLTVLFCTGFTIGCYLIFKDDIHYPVSRRFTLMSRAEWRASSQSDAIPRYKGPLTNVILTQTASDTCNNTSECSRLVRTIQQDHILHKNLSDIAYNFLIGGDGNTYEARGWHFQPHLKDIVCNQTLVVAFLGNFDYNLPPTQQIEEFKALVKEALEMQILDSCYTLNLYKNRFEDDGEIFVHVFNKLSFENNRRKSSMGCL